jgi:hypothetical protein
MKANNKPLTLEAHDGMLVCLKIKEYIVQILWYAQILMD